MDEERPQINIPENAALTSTEVKNRFDKIDKILVTVVVAVVIALISIIIAVIGVFLDQMRFNNVTYREYSQKAESIEVTQKTNEALLTHIQELLEQNKQDREIIRQLLKK
jgi:large-conductance mechanosensitive channel